MKLIFMITGALWFIFVSSYFAKLILIKKTTGVSAHKLGKGAKSKKQLLVETFVQVVTFLWLVVWIGQVVLNIGFKMGIGKLFNSFSLAVVGVLITGFGVLVFLTAMFNMKNSWRVGIDKKSKEELITTGVYKYSRNPAFVGFDFMFIGFALTFQNLISFLITVLCIIALHLLILLEEQHLTLHYGKNYSEYFQKVPRYF